jgi:hypothetical protein
MISSAIYNVLTAVETVRSQQLYRRVQKDALKLSTGSLYTFPFQYKKPTFGDVLIAKRVIALLASTI